MGVLLHPPCHMGRLPHSCKIMARAISAGIKTQLSLAQNVLTSAISNCLGTVGRWVSNDGPAVAVGAKLGKYVADGSKQARLLPVLASKVEANSSKLVVESVEE